MNKDQMKGRIKAALGKTQEVTGKATGDKTMEVEGRPKRSGRKSHGLYGNLKANLAKSYGPPSR